MSFLLCELMHCTTDKLYTSYHVQAAASNPPPPHTYPMIALQTWLNRYLESSQQISMHLFNQKT